MQLEQTLVELNLVDPTLINQAKTLHPNGKIQQILLDMGALSEEQLLSAYNHITGLPIWDGEGEIQKESGFDNDFLSYNNILPVTTKRGAELIIDNALDDGLIDLLKRSHPDSIIALHLTSEINRLIKQNFLLEEHDDNSRTATSSDLHDIEHLKDLALEAPIIRLVNDLFNQAVRLNASDIHLEPARHHIELRYRIDGILLSRTPPTLEQYPAVVSRIKILANLDISERRLPQDGRIRTKSSGHNIDVRVSTVPTPYGEDIVMRLLDQKKQILDLDKSGLSDNIIHTLKQILRKNHGIILVTGPTGSGKTTTLYSSLQHIIDGETKIITVEDPVEYEIPGITQIPVNDSIGMGFNNALRSILRHDPDVIFIGEIRDRETAEIAIQASLTGHLVLSTLHTNSAIGAINRFLDMGIPDYLLSSSLLAVSAQRLIRKLCVDCKQLDNIEPALLMHYHLKSDQPYYRAQGCHKCANTGYLGRIPIAEIKHVDSHLRQAILENPSIDNLNRAADINNPNSLLSDGLSKVKAGITSLEELQRVAG